MSAEPHGGGGMANAGGGGGADDAVDAVDAVDATDANRATDADDARAANDPAEPPIPDVAPDIDPSSFFAADLRVGRIIRAEPNAKARVPAYHLWIDLGPLGERQSSAQLTQRYTTNDLVGRTVIVAANLGVRRIAGVRSEVLVLGATDDAGRIALLDVDPGTPLGARVH